MNSEGIYRVSGSQDDIQELKLDFDRSKYLYFEVAFTVRFAVFNNARYGSNHWVKMGSGMNNKILTRIITENLLEFFAKYQTAILVRI